eukprot:760327-Hanusia_phi.AAC.7
MRAVEADERCYLAPHLNPQLGGQEAHAAGQAGPPPARRSQAGQLDAAPPLLLPLTCGQVMRATSKLARNILSSCLRCGRGRNVFSVSLTSLLRQGQCVQVSTKGRVLSLRVMAGVEQSAEEGLGEAEVDASEEAASACVAMVSCQLNPMRLSHVLTVSVR